MYDNGILDISQIQKMSIDETIGLYRQGYRLEEFYPNMDEILPYSRNRSGYEFMSPASCPNTIAKGSTKGIKIEVISPGTPPYTFKVYRDGNEIYTYIGGVTETSKTFYHKFDEVAGTYTYKGFVTDSCPTGIKTSTPDQCTVKITEEVPPPIGISPAAILLGLGVLGFVLLR